ncbi:MAG TPA: ABC transporter substrate-binding protein [Opitutae bacterium]|nr:ABC transporter substrate-binding protein [Opitutae bacterium]
MHRLIHNFLPLIIATLSALAESTIELRYAENFEITEFPTHRILTIRNTHPNTESKTQYALVSKDTPLPDLPDGITVIRTPVERVVVMETVYIGYLDAIQALDTIVGAGTVDFVSNSEVQARIQSKQIQSVQVGQGLDIERMLLLQPDLILTSISGDPALDVPAKLTRSGLPVVYTAGYMEAHPLARAEWIQYIAAFFEADELAAAQFQQVADDYEAFKAIAATAVNQPTVLAGAPYSGTWHVAAGQSYTAQAIRDAGGDYLWSDVDRPGAIALDTERVFLKAATADIWLNPSFYRSSAELFAADQRFKKFKAANEGNVFNNTKQVGPKGGNAIWEQGIVHPDKVLADMIKIFHPNRLPDHEFVFYERLQ